MNLFMVGGFLKFVSDAWMGIWIVINQMLYSIIELLYRVFVAVANVNLFDKDIFDSFTNRMYIVIAMAMVFIFAYNLILMIINPEDKKGTGQATKLVKETIISLVLVILLPTIFSYMAIFQKDVIDSQIITKIILGNGSETEDTLQCDFSKYSSLDKWYDNAVDNLNDACKDYNKLNKSKQGAYLMTPTLLNAFFYPTRFSLNTCATFIEECDGEELENCSSNTISDKTYNKKVCGMFFYGFKMSQYTGSLDYLIGNDELTDIVNEDDNEVLNFNYIFAVVGGIIALIMFASYTIMIGVRVAKLGFLQLISPIPVMMRIIPKQKEALFDKWLKELKNTYLDVFMRLIIINFSLYAISLVPDVIDNLGGGGDDSLPVVLLAKAVVILGILQFGKEAPGLFKEFFGGSGNFGIKKGFDTWKSTGSKVAGMGAAAVGAGVVGATRNVVNGKGVGKAFSGIGGFASGLVRGAKNGYKNGLSNTKTTVSNVANDVQAQATKHRATRLNGAINGKPIPIVSGVVGAAKNAWSGVTEDFDDFKGFMKGTVASSEVGNAANSIMNSISTMESDFSNATIKNIEAGCSEIMKNFNADKDFDFNGKHYHKIDENHWTDGTRDANGNYVATHESDQLSKDIISSFKNRLSVASGNNEMKSGIKEGYERAMDATMKNLREQMPMLGDGFANELFSKLNALNDINGNNMNLDVHSIDDLETKIKSMMDTAEGRANLYKVTDEIKSVAKGMKLSNDQAMKAQQAQKDKNKPGNK